ncbi:MAG: ATP-dependent RNA helicase HrpA, partial [Pseudomonadota bacterium]
MAAPDHDLAALLRRIPQAMRCDQHTLRRRAQRLLRRGKADRASHEELTRLTGRLNASIARREQRAVRVPTPEFSGDLPILTHREEIADAIAAHQVVVVCGETGSGKTTQLPQICLEAGRGVAGLIGHTQPRRIAARSVAARIAEELGGRVGEAIGFKVRFADRVSDNAFIKVMTDGVLLAETRQDPFLDQYDTLIIDEAHERGLNTDFILGYLKRLLPRRPDLKLIITSATIDPESFVTFFDGAPIINVAGRTWPVEVRYRPPPDEGESDPQQALLDAVDELATERAGDILVFLAGERDIRDAAEALRKHHPPETEVLPLYARLGTAEQNRIFASHRGLRIVLATNVAETSLTVPGIGCVVDTGVARISRYSYRSKVQRLPIEKVSQASADQRKGRCGRLGPGVCIRLYSEEDFHARPEFGEPEILRTNLAGVVLQMQSMRLGKVEDFPFMDAPDYRLVNDGYKLLHELGALDERRLLTPLGRQLARLPLDPRIGRMLLGARDEACLREVLIIAAALSIQDPRERPMQAAQQADAAHRAFQHKDSDFLLYLRLWNGFEHQRRHLSKTRLRRYCRDHFLSYIRMLEWRDIHNQLHAMVSDFGYAINTEEATEDSIHRALLSGLLGNVALKKDNREYTGVRNVALQIFPGSALSERRPKWIMAAEWLETRRLYAHTVAAIRPQWIERLAPHLLKRSYAEPHWERKVGHVVAFEQATLYGLLIHSRRRVHYGPIAPDEARAIFIRAALVEGDCTTRAPFFAHNRALIAQLEESEHKTRRHDVVTHPEDLFALYDAAIPAEVNSVPALEAWYKSASRSDPQLLRFSREQLMRGGSALAAEQSFPPQLDIGDLHLRLTYHFEPGAPNDGVSAEVPVAILNQLEPAVFAWLVPGLLRDKVIALIKLLPKSLRRHFVPAPDFADACLESMTPYAGDLIDALAAQLQRVTGVEITRAQWTQVSLPEHLQMRYRVVDANGCELAAGRNLADLQQRCGGAAQDQVTRLVEPGIEREGLTAWDFDELPQHIELQRGVSGLKGYPALIDEGRSVALRVLDNAVQARAATRIGLRRLLMLQMRDRVKYLGKHLEGIDRACMAYASLGSCDALKSDVIAVAFDAVFIDGRELPRKRAQFDDLCESGRGQLVEAANGISRRVVDILSAYRDITRQLGEGLRPQWLPAVQDIREQL